MSAHVLLELLHLHTAERNNIPVQYIRAPRYSCLPGRAQSLYSWGDIASQCFFCFQLVFEGAMQTYGVKSMLLTLLLAICIPSRKSWCDPGPSAASCRPAARASLSAIMITIFCPVCVFIIAVPITKLCAWGEGDSGGHVLRETTSRGLCGLVCPSRTSERGGAGLGDCVEEGGGEEGER
jgi:hypothetical protein